MLGVYLSIKTNSLTGRSTSLFTVFDLSTPLTKTLSIEVHSAPLESLGNVISGKKPFAIMLCQLVRYVYNPIQEQQKRNLQ